MKIDLFGIRRIVFPVMIFALLLAILYIIGQHILLKQAEVVYSHPATKVRIKRVAGAVTIRTVVVERAGEKITTTEEKRGEVVETNDTDSAPVPLSVTMAARRTDRFLVGASAAMFDGPPEIKSATWWVGYSIGNRLDVKAGYRYDDSVKSVYIGGRF
jgi:hypothetical protein